MAPLTALITIEDTIQLKKGETFLVQGGAGGVANFAMRLGKYLGARVIATASAPNHDYLHALGADQVIDYRSQDFTKVAQPCERCSTRSAVMTSARVSSRH